jgi:hypothetical protein
MMAGMTKNHIRWKEAAEMWKENWLVTTLCLGTMAFFFFILVIGLNQWSIKYLFYLAGGSAFLAPCKIDRSKSVTILPPSNPVLKSLKIFKYFPVLLIIPSSPAIHKETFLTLSLFLKKA